MLQFAKGIETESFSQNYALSYKTTNGYRQHMEADATNFSWTGTGGFVTDASVTRTFTCGTTGGTSAVGPNLNYTGSGTAVQTFTTGGWWNRLDFGSVSFTIPTTILNLNTFVANTGVTYTGLTVNIVKTVTVDFGGKAIAAFTVNVPGGTVTLGSLVPFSAATATTTLTAGTLDLGGFNLTTGVFSSNNSNVRSLVLGSNNIVLSTTTAGSINLDMANATNFTWTGTGGFTSTMSVTRTFSFGSTAGGSATNAPNLSLTSGASIPTITSGSWFKTLSFTGSTCAPNGTVNVDTLTLATGGTYTGGITCGGTTGGTTGGITGGNSGGITGGNTTGVSGGTTGGT
jgi:hypothetical protein